MTVNLQAPRALIRGQPYTATSWQAHAWTLKRCMPDQFATPSLLVRIKALEEHQVELRRLLRANGHNPEEFLDFSPGDEDGHKVEGQGERLAPMFPRGQPYNEHAWQARLCGSWTPES